MVGSSLDFQEVQWVHATTHIEFTCLYVCPSFSVYEYHDIGSVKGIDSELLGSSLAGTWLTLDQFLTHTVLAFPICKLGANLSTCVTGCWWPLRCYVYLCYKNLSLSWFETEAALSLPESGPLAYRMGSSVLLPVHSSAPQKLWRGQGREGNCTFRPSTGIDVLARSAPARHQQN
jgi:hypothetical protein